MNNDSLTGFTSQINKTHFMFSTNPDIPVIFAVILSPIVGFTIIANTVVITALVRFRKNVGSDVTRNSAIATMLMMSLAFADGLVGVLVMPLCLADLINNGKWEMGQALCVARCILNNMLSSVSVFHIACMAIDRYMAVCKPMKYQVLTTKVGFFMIGVAWTLPVFLILMPTINGWDQSGQEEFVRVLEESKVCIRIVNQLVLSVSVVLTFYLPLAATYTLYFLILRDIQNFTKRRKHYLKTGVIELPVTKFPKTVREELKESLKISAVELTAYINRNTQASKDRPTEDRTFTSTPGNDVTLDRPPSYRNVKAYRTIGTILICFTVCWLPLGLVAGALPLVDFFDFPLWLGVTLNWVSIMNTALNPVLYCGNKSVRRIVLSLLCSPIKLLKTTINKACKG